MTKIKDIVNRSNVNLQNCDQEPIHIPGSIQPHGCLLAASADSLKIKFCSGNCSEMLGVAYDTLLGTSLHTLVDDKSRHLLAGLGSMAPGRTQTVSLELQGRLFEFIAHVSGPNVLLETEQYSDPGRQPDMVELSKEMVTYIEETHTLNELCVRVAEGTRKITGYDRVMIYRFDEQYNGEVIAESKDERFEAFYGLHYPHTDIPAQARELYIKNQLRVIVDVNYQPVPIYTIDDGSDHTLDMSLSMLRSVSPMHTQYLHNMGVGATLTISLLHKQKLWGLVACHHYSPKYLSYETRMAAKLLGHFITSQIDTRMMNEEYETARKANDAVDQMGSRDFDLNRSSFGAMVNDPAILNICNASGVSLLMDNVIYKSRLTPDDEEIRRLSNYLATYSNHGEFATNTIISHQPELRFSETLPGVNYISLDNASLNCIIWYRHETVREVNWAGDPAKSIEKDQNGLSPRKSFDLWKETVKHQSTPWLKSELSASLAFANQLEKHISAVVLAEEEEKQRELAQALKQTNAELENINWISTHDLQEPLRKIQLMASLLMSDGRHHLAPEVNEKIGKMNQFAARMQSLIKDILRYTRLNYSSEALESIDLNALMEEVRIEVADIMREKSGTLSIQSLPIIKGVPFLIRQLFSNLIYNSVKFRREEMPLLISITQSEHLDFIPEGMHQPVSAYFLIEYKDNGIGFDASFNESVFKIFTRLHSGDRYSGSGIGLALCRKIMSSHRGFITAKGVVGQGVTFSLYFPKF